MLSGSCFSVRLEPQQCSCVCDLVETVSLFLTWCQSAVWLYQSCPVVFVLWWHGGTDLWIGPRFGLANTYRSSQAQNLRDKPGGHVQMSLPLSLPRALAFSLPPLKGFCLPKPPWLPPLFASHQLPCIRHGLGIPAPLRTSSPSPAEPHVGRSPSSLCSPLGHSSEPSTRLTRRHRLLGHASCCS